MMRRIWILGASSGIGLELAKKLIAQGHTLILSSRQTASLSPLQEQHPQRVFIQTCDVTSSSSVETVVENIKLRFGGIDVIVYNAGICEYVNGGDISFESCQRVFDSNFYGLVRCCEKAQSLLSAGVAPQLMAVASSAAFIALPRAEFYGASKAAMSYFLQSLRLAWQQKGIAVQIVYPGFVKTPLTDKNDFPMPFMISAEQAAERIAAAIANRSNEIHFPRRFTLILKLIGLFPLSIQQCITKRLV